MLVNRSKYVDLSLLDGKLRGPVGESDLYSSIGYLFPLTKPLTNLLGNLDRCPSLLLPKPFTPSIETLVAVAFSGFSSDHLFKLAQAIRVRKYFNS